MLYPTLGRDFPLAQETTPENVLLKAADGLESTISSDGEAQRRLRVDPLRQKCPGKAREHIARACGCQARVAAPIDVPRPVGMRKDAAGAFDDDARAELVRERVRGGQPVRLDGSGVVPSNRPASAGWGVAIVGAVTLADGRGERANRPRSR